MKNSIVYVLVFSTAFAVTSYTIYSLNSKYENIFNFDFRLSEDVARADRLSIDDSEQFVSMDSTDVIEESKRANEELKLKYEEAKTELAKTSKELSTKENEIAELRKLISEKENNKHEEWLKTTVKLYEEMESRKAGELLTKLPDKEARELLYSMKRKKAAQILSNLNTETVKRLTRAQK